MLWIVLDGAVLHGDVEMSKIELGVRVAFKIKSHDSNLQYGTIINKLPDRKVIVQWEQQRWQTIKPEPTIEKISDLMLGLDAEKKLSELSDAFDLLEQSVRSKMVEAANFLLEANELALAGGQSLLDMHDTVYPLLNAMEECGWSISSLGC